MLVVIPARSRRPCERRDPYAAAYLWVRWQTAVSNFSLWLWVPAFAETTLTVTPPLTVTPHTAILRCRTGAPTVRLSAASMIALASMP
jgi:hypothetical protein